MKAAPLTDEEKSEALLRSKYAKTWLEKYAANNDKFEVQASLPPAAKTLSADQKKFLNGIAALLKEKQWKGEDLHAAIHELRKSSPLQAADAFKAIYIALLGKDSGPQAGWFLEALPKEFVVKRFLEV